MYIENIAPASSEPLLLDEVKQHLKLDHREDDVGIAAFISAARAHLETYLGFALINRSVRITAMSWSELGVNPLSGGLWLANTPCAPGDSRKQELSLPVRPVQSVQSIQVIGPDGVEATWGSENYQLIPGLEPKLILGGDSSWPQVDGSAAAIKIEATIGFGESWNDIPPDLHQALLRLTTHFAYTRGDESTGGLSPITASGSQTLVAGYINRRIG